MKKFTTYQISEGIPDLIPFFLKMADLFFLHTKIVKIDTFPSQKIVKIDTVPDQNRQNWYLFLNNMFQCPKYVQCPPSRKHLALNTVKYKIQTTEKEVRHGKTCVTFINALRLIKIKNRKNYVYHIFELLKLQTCSLHFSNDIALDCCIQCDCRA